MVQVRSHWIGRHLGGFLPDTLYYPEAQVPVETIPKELDTSRKGVATNILNAAAMKKRLSIPVAVVGRLDADLGEKFLGEGLVDFIAMTRRLLADPEYVNKIASGRHDDIAPCTACINCLRTSHCRVNGLMGTPYNTIEKTDKKKKVLVDRRWTVRAWRQRESRLCGDMTSPSTRSFRNWAACFPSRPW